MIIVSRIIHVKVDRRLNVTNKFKYRRRLSSRLAIVMFRGTPCRLDVHLSKVGFKLLLGRMQTFCSSDEHFCSSDADILFFG